MHNMPVKINPLGIIAVISVIIFSLVGIAAMTGQMPVVNSDISVPAVRGEVSGIKPNITPIIMEKRASAQQMRRANPCVDCGVVDSIIVNDVNGGGGGAGTVGGREFEKNVNKPAAYQVKVRMDDGTDRVISLHDQPIFHVGEKVKIVNGMVVQLEGTTMMDKNRIFALMLAALTSRIF
jgi:outer membrane lipoprotein SlyB